MDSPRSYMRAIREHNANACQKAITAIAQTDPMVLEHDEEIKELFEECPALKKIISAQNRAMNEIVNAIINH